MPVILEVKNLVKKYNHLSAVNGVSFRIQQGTCFGLLGPNGAGKTTTIEIIENVTSPTSGEILYNGLPRTPSFSEEVGIQFQETTLLSYITVRETLDIFKKLYREAEDVDRLIHLCRLSEFQHQMNDKISGGQRQRFFLALALINKPKLIFLDEPSTGLDPQARHNLWNIIQTIKADGRTIILTTHYMEEAQHLCDEIAIMDNGKIIARGVPDELISTHCSGVTIVLPKDAIPFSLDRLSVPHKDFLNRVEIETEDINQSMAHLMSLGVNLANLMVRSPNLETVFLNLTGRQLRD
jgi:ABC-2 type transport system ATP-binding protein